MCAGIEELQYTYINCGSEFMIGKLFSEMCMKKKTHTVLQKILLACFLSQVTYLVKHPYLGIKPHGNNHNDVLHHNHLQQFFVVHGIR